MRLPVGPYLLTLSGVSSRPSAKRLRSNFWACVPWFESRDSATWQQVWDATALRSTPLLLRDAPVDEDILELPPAPEGEEILFDYAATGLTLRRHPLALLRPILAKRRLSTAADLHDLPNGRLVRYCGLVTLRQQPETANGVIFVSLEDETGVVQVICWRRIREAQRRELLESRLLAVYGTWQREGELRSLVAGRLQDLTPLLGRLAPASRDFH